MLPYRAAARTPRPAPPGPAPAGFSFTTGRGPVPVGHFIGGSGPHHAVYTPSLRASASAPGCSCMLHAVQLTRQGRFSKSYFARPRPCGPGPDGMLARNRCGRRGQAGAGRGRPGQRRARGAAPPLWSSGGCWPGTDGPGLSPSSAPAQVSMTL